MNIKNKILSFGRSLLLLNPPTVVIYDDEDVYFTQAMLKFSHQHGLPKCVRKKFIDDKELKSLVTKPYDIVILDVKGVVDPSVAIDGLQVCDYLKKNTNSYVVVTSAHQHHLSNRTIAPDYIISERSLTYVDFTKQLKIICESYLKLRLAPYKKISFRLGFFIVKKTIGM